MAATVATGVRPHGTSPWGLEVRLTVCIDERETPQRKTVASYDVWPKLIFEEHMAYETWQEGEKSC